MTRQQNGFTLLEIILACIILGILAAMEVAKDTTLQDNAGEAIMHWKVGIVEDHVIMVYENMIFEKGSPLKVAEVATAVDCATISDELTLVCGSIKGSDTSIVVVVRDDKSHVSYKNFELT